MFKSFDRYILKEISSPFGMGLLVYTFTLLVNTIFPLAPTLIAKDVPATTILQILVYMLPDFFSFTIPMATLMGVLAGLSRMSTDSEIVAFRTMGVDNYRILKPVLGFSFVGFLFSMWLIMYMAPEANFRLIKIMEQIGAKHAISNMKPGDFYTDLPLYTLYFSDVDRNTDEWKDIFLYSRKESDSDTIILAKKGNFIPQMHEKESYIILKDVVIHSFKKKESMSSYRVSYFNSLKEHVENPEAISNVRRERQLIFPELVRRMKKEPDNRQMRIEFHRKFALPFTCLALAFLGLSLGISTRKGGKVTGFIISLGIIFVYYTISVSMENIVRKGTVSPFLGMWFANIFLLIIGIIMYYYSSKEKSINWERLFAIAESFKKQLRQKKQMVQRKVLLVIKIKRFHFGFRIFKIIDVYVVKKLVLTFFMVFSSLIMIFYVVGFVEKINEVVENKVSVSYIFKYLYYDTPEIISFVLPVASLTCVLLTFSVMSKNNEITAVKVGGISLYRLTLPALIFGILISGAYFYVQERITPGANKNKQLVLNVIRNVQIKTEDERTKNWVLGKGNVIYFYEFLDKTNGKISNFNAIYLDPNFSIKRRITTNFAQWNNDKELILDSGFERKYRGNEPYYFTKFSSRHMEISEGKDLFTSKIAFPRYMNIETLKRYIQYLKDKKAETHKYEAQLYYKYAFPLSSVMMVLIAIPFSFLMGYRGTLFGIGIAVAMSIIFWFAFGFFNALGSAGLLSPFLSAFAPIFIFAALSTYLFINVKT